MSARNHNPPIPADATRLAGLPDRTEIKTGEPRLAGDGDRSILAIQLGAQASTVAAERYKIGDRIGGRYEVLAIHRGSMGVVYGTFDHKTQLPRALKTLQERFTSKVKLRDLFLEEAAAWVKLGKHPFIVRAYLVEKYDGRPYVITEYIRGEEGMGGDLQAWLGHRRMTLKLAVELALQIAQGMQHAARTIPGFVHRDLKPANVLVDNRARAMVTDFGLVCATEVEAGTPAYMAPELWNGESPDGRTDIYAFGCVLYEMLTGHRMFSANSVEQWRHAHLTQTPVAPSTLRPGIPVGTSAFVMKCLARTQSGRPQEWDEVVNELAAQFHRLTGQPAVLNFTAYELTIDELVSASYSLMHLEKYADVILISDRVLAINPGYEGAWNNKGGALNSLKRYEEALACYDRALEIHPSYSLVLVNKGSTLDSLRRYDAALACYDRALEINPNYDLAWARKGRTLDSLEHYEAAITSHNRALEINPNFDWAWGNKGRTLASLKRYVEAIACYDRMLRNDPNSDWAWASKGRALSHLDRDEEAIVCYDRALDIEPFDADTWNNKAVSLKYLKRPNEAITCYERSLKIRPNCASVWVGKGSLLAALNRHNEAISCYDYALEIDPKSAVYWNGKGDALGKLERYEEAIVCYDHALENDPNSDMAWSNKGGVLRQLKRHEEVVACCHRAVGINPKSIYAWLILGFSLNDLLRHAEALSCFVRILEIYPHHAYAWFSKGQTLSYLKHYNEAIECLNQALAFDPNNVFAWSQNGTAFISLQRYDEGIGCYRRALEIDPSNKYIEHLMSEAQRMREAADPDKSK